MFKKLTILCSLLLIGLMGFSQQLPPKPAALVTDFTNTISPGDIQLLENKVVAFDDSTSTQIAVVVMHSVGENDINEYAQKLGRAWGIGQKGKNNGVVILVALDDHKVSIQTGYGSEGGLPDVTTQDIIRNDIVPNFKQKDYYGGLNAATDDVIKAMKGEYKGTGKPHAQGNSGGSYGILFFIVIIIIIIIFRSRGGGGGQVIGGRGVSPFWWFLGGAMLGRGSGGWGGFSGGDGGGGDGGGFGGFGGGDFGGGGSSGSW